MHRLITAATIAIVSGLAIGLIRRRREWPTTTAAMWWLYLVGLTQITIGTPRRVSAAFCRSNRDLDRWRLGVVGSLRAELADNPWAIQTLGALVQLGANVALFVPLGVLAATGVRRHPVIAASGVGAAVSLGIELTQRTGTLWVHACAHRTADVDDLWCNVLGAALGGVLVRHYSPRSRVDPA